MSTLYVARHGETDYNRLRIFQGSSDIPLNATGLGQARELLEAVRARNLVVDRILSSPYLRAKATAEVLARGLGVPLEVNDGLRERSLGQFEGVPAAEIERRFPDFWARYGQHSFYDYDAIPGGETLLDLETRLFAAMRGILLRYPDRNLLILTHGYAARMIHRFFGRDTGSFHLRNCEVLEYSPVEAQAAGRLPL